MSEIKNKVFSLSIDDCGYEEYDAFVVIAKDLERAKAFILEEYDNPIDDSVLYSWKEKEIKSIIVGETNLSERVVLASFIRA